MPGLITIRFYEELNDFLPRNRRKKEAEVRFSSHQTIKDIIEACGVPHGEVDLILINGESVQFSHRPGNGDRVSVYPVFESLDIGPVNRLRSTPLRKTIFILDVHLGKLARYLRMLGFDTIYRNDLADDEIIRIAAAEKRIILTRDIQLLKHGRVTHGQFIRATEPREQLREVIKRLDLAGKLSPFSICMNCNGRLHKADKETIFEELEPLTRKHFDEFYRCDHCGKIYWPGSHWESMQALVEELK